MAQKKNKTQAALTFPDGHDQVLVPVMASVDEGIAEIVRVLNTFKNVFTTHSCEGDAYVQLGYHGTPQKTTEFMVWLTDVLDDVPTVRVTMRWCPNKRFAITIRFDPGQKGRVLNALLQKNPEFGG